MLLEREALGQGPPAIRLERTGARPLFEGRDLPWLDTLGVESQIGRMVVRGDGYKYIRYDFDGMEEQLLDLNKDPHETTHFTDSPEHKGKLRDLRRAFEKEWFPNI